jgi:hypothetical protein
VYSTCIFCTRSLGHNEALEHFPVGRRLAFDAAKGRLWVVCVHCGRWNLTPLEERWEAVEEAERLFRAAPLRVSTDHIGLARIADGTDLVRIGAPQRPELAAWRYGEQFTRRRYKYLLAAGAAVAIGGAAVAGGIAAGTGVFLAYQLGRTGLSYAMRGIPFEVVARIRDSGGQLIPVRRKHLLKTTIGIGRDGGLALDIEHGERHPTRVEGVHARRAASALFQAVNRRGGTGDEVQTALRRLMDAGSAEQFLSDVVRGGSRLTRGIAPSSSLVRSVRQHYDASYETGLMALSTTFSLAIEMALHEEQERQVLEGELAELEEAWRDAEEIGAIADAMFLPSSVEQALARLRGRK